MMYGFFFPVIASQTARPNGDAIQILLAVIRDSGGWSSGNSSGGLTSGVSICGSGVPGLEGCFSVIAARTSRTLDWLIPGLSGEGSWLGGPENKHINAKFTKTMSLSWWFYPLGELSWKFTNLSAILPPGSWIPQWRVNWAAGNINWRLMNLN